MLAVDGLTGFEAEAERLQLYNVKDMVCQECLQEIFCALAIPLLEALLARDSSMKMHGTAPQHLFTYAGRQTLAWCRCDWDPMKRWPMHAGSLEQTPSSHGMLKPAFCGR